MSSYYIQSLEVRKLWGYKSINLTFDRNLNILIGPNASGKTTILNLLRFVLVPDPLGLNEVNFSHITITLGSFSGNSKRTVKVDRKETGLLFSVSQSRYFIELESIHRYRNARVYMSRRSVPSKIIPRELSEHLDSLISAIWLPVSRRLPITSATEEDDEMNHQRRTHSPPPSIHYLETVDVRLNKLMEELVSYRLRLDAQLSDHYRNDFENQVLQTILYRKEYDQMSSLKIGSPPTDEEKEQLIGAFKAAGLLDSQMQERIDEHFDAAREALARISKDGGKVIRNVGDIFIIPLIERTRSIVGFAANMEKYREDLFAPLRKYEEIVNSFLNEKMVTVEESGNMTVEILPTT